MGSTVPSITLNDGTNIPSIGFGMGTAFLGKECSDAVTGAIKIGYSYIDCAQMYNNGGSMKDALAAWGGKREDLYISQKCGISDKADEEKNPRVILMQLLKAMGTDYVDSYLLHSPLFFAPRYTINEAWAIMEELKAEGLAKSIGISNFRAEDIVKLQKTWKVAPAVNQIEFHPYVFHAPNMLRLASLCDSLNIHITCYGPLAPIVNFPGGPVDPVVNKIAEAKGAEPSQILIAWAAQKSKGVIVTTSKNPDRQVLQLDAIAKMAPLSEAEMNEISEAGKNKFCRRSMGYLWAKAEP